MWEMGKDKADIFRRKKQVKDKILFCHKIYKQFKGLVMLCAERLWKSQALRGDSEVGMDDAATFLEGS